ncbi:hypothetical protein D3C72_1469580 [compost metagenome]
MNTVRTLGWRSRTRNGPVPLALNEAVFSMPLRRSTGLVAWFSSHHFLLMIMVSEITSGRIGNGPLVSISTARSPTLRTALISLSVAFMSEPSPCARAKLNTTSSALNGVPSWNTTPLRSSKRHTFGEVCFQLVASSGARLRSLLRPTRVS